jgi:uncharacterized tellurite resistance protein B-like protein
MVIHKDFPDFVLFLYVYMAYADGVFHPSEKEAIMGKMSKLFPHEQDPKSKILAAEKEYLEFDSSMINDLIHDTFKYFSHVKFNQKYKIYTDMYDIINADGKVDHAETMALSALKKIIDLGAAEHAA